jgi:hypothetical protein
MFLNLVDFSVRIWSQMQLDNAAEIGAQAAYNACAGVAEPVTTNCTSMNSAVTTAIQSTSLGTNVTLASGSPTETYYCTNTSTNTLQSVGTPSSPPSPFDCTAAGNPSVTPGDYITVKVNYTFNPMFPGLSLLSSSTLSSTGLTRLQ